MSQEVEATPVKVDIKINIPKEGQPDAVQDKAKSQEVVNREEQERKKIAIKGSSEQEKINNARVSYQEFFAKENDQPQPESIVFDGKIEKDTSLPPARTYTEKLVQAWAKNAYGGSVVFEIDNTQDKGLIVVLGTDAKWHVVLPDESSAPPTGEQLKNAIKKIAPDGDGLVLGATKTLGGDFTETARQLSQDPDINDAIVQEIYAAGADIQEIINEQFGPGKIPESKKTRSDIAAERFIASPAREENVKQLVTEITQLVAKKEFDITSAKVNFSKQIISEFANYVTGREVSIDPSASVYVASDENTVKIGLPKDATLADIAAVAKLLNPEGASLYLPKKMQEFADQLLDTGRMMSDMNASQKKGKTLFSEEAIATVTQAGKDLQQLLGTENTTVQQQPLSDERKNDLYLKIMLGKGVTYTTESGLQEAFYEKAYQSWEKRNSGKTREDFDAYLLSDGRKALYLSFLAPSIDKSLAEGGISRAAMKDVAGQKSGSEQIILQAELNKWRNVIDTAKNHKDENFTQRIDKALVEVRMEKRENITVADELAAVNRLFQANGSGELIHAPAQAIPYFLDAENPELADGNPSKERGCLVVDAYAITEFEKLGYSVNLHFEGNHPFFYIMKDGQLFQVDPKTPISVGTGVTEITGDDRTRILENIANDTLSKDEKITAGLLYNNAQELLQKKEIVRGIELLLKADEINPNAAIIKYALSQVDSDYLSEELKQQYLEKALAIESDIAEKWEASKGMIGKWTKGKPITEFRYSYPSLVEEDVRAIEDFEKGGSGIVGWFKDEVIKFAYDWKSGNMPTNSKFEAFQLKTTDAFKLSLAISNAEGINTDAEKLFQQYTTSRDSILPALMSAVNLQQGGDEKMQAGQNSAHSLGQKGVQHLEEANGLYQEPTVLYMRRIGTSRMDWQRKEDGGYLKTASIPKVRQDCVEAIFNQAKNGIGIYKEEKKRIWNDAKYTSDDQKETALKRRIEADYVIGEWINIVLLKEQSILGKGIPAQAEAESPWEARTAHNTWQNFVRWAMRDENWKKFIFGKRDPKNPQHDSKNVVHGLDNIPLIPAPPGNIKFRDLQRYFGPYRVHVVKNALEMIGYKTNSMNVAQWKDAIEGISEFEFFPISDELTSNTWKMSEHKKAVDNYKDAYLTKALGEAKAKGAIFPEKYLKPDPTDPNNRAKYLPNPDAYDPESLALGERMRFLKTGLDPDEPNDVIRGKRKDLFEKQFRKFMPEKMMAALYESDPQDKTFESFFADTPSADFLDNLLPPKGVPIPPGFIVRPGMRHHGSPINPNKPQERELSEREERAQRRFQKFMEYFGNQLDTYRQNGYHNTLKEYKLDSSGNREIDPITGKPILIDYIDKETGKPVYVPEQRNFGDFKKEAPEDFNGMETYLKTLKVKPGAVIEAENFQTLMSSMSAILENSGVSNKLAGDRNTPDSYKYLHLHYKSITDEDALLHIDQIRDPWLKALTSGEEKSDLANAIGDRITVNNAGKILMEQVVTGNYNDPETIIKGVQAARAACIGLVGNTNAGVLVYNHAGMFMETIKLNGPFGFLGWDARNKLASMGKEYFGVHVHGKNPEQILEMYEEQIAHFIVGEGKAATAMRDRFKKEVGIDIMSLWAWNRLPKYAVDIILAYMIEGLNEIQPSDLHAS